MSKKLKVNFVDFWPNLVKDDNYFYNLLKLEYDVEIDEENPDVLFFSVDYLGTRERFNYKNCLKVFYTGENTPPNFNECDIAFTFERSEDDRNYRLPLWALHLNWFERPYIEERDQAYLHPISDMTNKPDPNVILQNKDHFCSFVATQPKGERVSFVPNLINSYKDVVCAGGLHNNVRGVIRGRGDQIHKINFLQAFKFNISFENCSNDGYATEKIIHSMFANCLPIYWGDPNIGLDFNKDSFLDLCDFESQDSLIERIREIDENEDLYKEIISQPWFKNNQIPDFVQPRNVLDWIKKWIQ
tara:strand:+ start:213 stop:1115 length:903 start_codon:yes stop_codon:yes gene_type:complete